MDEIHIYRGVFGSHMANVIRRLKRICEFYGSKPQFICCSATIANPLELAEKIAEVLGVEAGSAVRKTAFVKCAGSCSKAKEKYTYYGVEDCSMAEQLPGKGAKGCTYGCHGYGNCVRVCEFDAIHIVDGIAYVNKDKCKACGKCVLECPRNLIEIVPYSAKHLVQCSSKDKGKDVKSVCDIGCIACKMCEKVCEFDAIKVVDNIAHIDYEKCTNCGKCAEKCPVKVIL